MSSAVRRPRVALTVLAIALAAVLALLALSVFAQPAFAAPPAAPLAQECPTPPDYEELWTARDAEFGAAVAVQIASADPTGVATAGAVTTWTPLAIHRYTLESQNTRWSDCESGKHVEQLDVKVSTRASQDSVDAIEAKLDASLDATVSSRASQLSVNTLEAKADRLEGKADALATAVASRASQTSVDALEAKADALEVKLSSLATSLSSFATVVQNLLSGPVVLWEGIDFTGGRLEVGADDACLDDNFYSDGDPVLVSGFSTNNIRAIQVPSGTKATLYTECNFLGTSKVFTADDNDLRDDTTARSAKSIKVERTRSTFIDQLATKTDANDIKSQATTIDTKLDTLDTLSLALPRKLGESGHRGPVTVFNGINFTGASAMFTDDEPCLTGQSYNLVGPNVSLDNTILSIRVPPGQEVTLYDQCNFQGTNVRIGSDFSLATVSDPDLRDNIPAGFSWNGVSSIQFRRSLGSVLLPDIASQSSLDRIEAKLDAFTPGGSAGLDALEAKADAIESKLDANLDVKVSTLATQASVDALQAKADRLEGKADALAAAVATKASQESVDRIEIKADTIEAKLDAQNLSIRDIMDFLGRLEAVAIGALEAKADRLEGKADALATAVATKASQDSVDRIEAKADRLEGKADALATAVATKASQDSVDRLEGKADALATSLDAAEDTIVSEVRQRGDFIDTRLTDETDEIDVALSVLEGKADRIDGRVDVAVSSRASQLSVNNVGDAVDALEGKADRAETKLDSLASAMAALEAKADALATSVTAETGELDASIGVLESKADRIEATVSTRSSQASVDILTSSIVEVASHLDGIGAQIARSGRIVVEVVEEHGNRRFLLLTTVDGVMVNTTITKVLGVSESRSAYTASDITSRATVRAVATGLLDVQFAEPGRRDPPVKAYVVALQYTDADGVVHRGAASFRATGSGDDD